METKNTKNKDRGVLFDVDGTLLNTREGILSSIGATLRHFGMRPLKPDEERLFIGPPIQDSLAKVFGMNKEDAQAFANVFRSKYAQPEFLFQAEPSPGIISLMQGLKESGYKIAVATYKREDYAIDIVTHFGMAEFADSIHGADNNNVLKKTDIMKLCIRDLMIETSSCVMIGDSDNDAIGAQTTGCPFIGVTYGFGFGSANDVAEFAHIGIASSPEEILPIISVFFSGS